MQRVRVHAPRARARARNPEIPATGGVLRVVRIRASPTAQRSGNALRHRRRPPAPAAALGTFAGRPVRETIDPRAVHERVAHLIHLAEESRDGVSGDGDVFVEVRHDDPVGVVGGGGEVVFPPMRPVEKRSASPCHTSWKM